LSWASCEAETAQAQIQIIAIAMGRPAPKAPKIVIANARSKFGSGGISRCPYRKLDPDVLVMQAAQDWHRQNTADGLFRAGDWTILVQG
jgi:hypothetical protein